MPRPRSDKERAYDKAYRERPEQRAKNKAYQAAYYASGRKKKQTREYLKNRDLLKSYGITLAEYNFLVEKQGNICAICGKPPKTGRSLHVDHDHKLKGPTSVRGILCTFCNHRFLGRHRDPKLFLRAAEYLTNPPAQKMLKEYNEKANS